MDTDKALREHLLYVLGGGGAHADFDSARKHDNERQCYTIMAGILY